MSRTTLEQLGLCEIYDMPGWVGFLENAWSVLPANKSYLKSELAARSTAMWRASMLEGTARGIEIMVQELPQSVGQRLLDAGYLNLLVDADSWDKLRLGLVGTSHVAGTAMRSRCCAMCGGLEYGFSHLLARCELVSAFRLSFLSEVGAPWMDEAPAADWVAFVFSPHQPLARLQASVRFCARMVEGLLSRKQQNKKNTRKTLACVLC